MENKQERNNMNNSNNVDNDTNMRNNSQMSKSSYRSLLKHTKDSKVKKFLNPSRQLYLDLYQMT